MGKPKKGKKGRQDDDWEDDDIETKIESLSIENNREQENSEAQEVTEPKAKKKDKKKKSKKADSDEDEQEKHDSDEEEEGKGKVQNSAMSAFQMLAMDSDDHESPVSSEPEEDTPKPVSKKDKKKLQKQKSSFDEDEEMSAEAAQQVTTTTKSKKKGKEKKPEEDIDALLAEIESTDKKDGGKGKKKKKGKGQQEESMDVTESVVEQTEAAEPDDKELAAKDISNMTQDEIAAWLDDGTYDEEEDKKKKKKKKGKKQQPQAEATADVDGDEDMEEGDEEAEGTVKTAAQKKKEKKDRQKQQKLMEKTKPQTKAPAAEKSAAVSQSTEAESIAAATAVTEEVKEDQEEDGEDEDKKKKKKDRKKKKKGEEEQQEEKKKKPSKMALAIQEMQKKVKDEEERLRNEEEEKERISEEKRKLKEETDAKDKEKKDKEKQKKREKIERQKAEGKFLTEKQKADKIRAAQMLEHLKAQGLAVPQPGEGVKKRVVYGKKKKKQDPKQDGEITPVETPTEEKELNLTEEIKEEIPEEIPEEKQVETKEIIEEKGDVKDAWDAESEEDEEEIETKEATPEKTSKAHGDEADEEEESEEESEEEDEEESEDESEEESSEEESDEEDDRTPIQKMRDRARARIEKRKEAAEKNQSTDELRAPVVCVLGHVDTGKTKILDKLRRTHVQDDEAGGITQQIGATNVPMDALQNQTKMCKEFTKQELKLPGLLIIDTPGHESFSNLRTRGSSLCDIAILVIDIMHGLEPQTIESINLLKKRKTPFVVALNKVDRLFQWQSNPHTDIVNTLKKQKTNTKQEFDERTQVAIVQLAEQGLNACLFHENKNVREYVSMVPTSAHSGDGMGNLIALICELTQSVMAKKLAFSEELQATVMEVKAIQGLGTTIDVILVNGRIHEGDTIIIAGQEGPIVTTVRALLMPQPMKELRVKNAYSKFKEVQAAQGCKIIAKDLDKALAGLPLYIAEKQDEVEFYKEEISEALEEVLGSIKLQDKGVFVQASTLGSLEALLEFLRTSKIPYAGINIGPVHKKDIMRASVMLEHDTQWAVILAFDVKIEREAQEMADSLGVTIFTAEIIYHLFDRFMAHRDQLKKHKQEEFKHIAVFPCKLRILPQCIFNSRDPIVCGVAVEAGFVKIGTPLCVPSKEGLDIGRVTSLELNHKPVDKATKGQEVCVKIEAIPGEAPKLYGRHFDHTDLLISKITRESIDVVKNYFRDDMSKNDWQLVLEMKTLFEII